MKITNILRNIFVIVTLLLCASVVFLLVSETKCFAVQSNSMAPMLERGDVVFVRPVEFENLSVGDVISAHFPGSDGVFTHRIIQVDSDKEQIRTRGDGNMSDDPQPTQADKIIGKLWFSVPFIGLLSLNLQNRTFLMILVGIALVLVMVRVLFTMRKKKDE